MRGSTETKSRSASATDTPGFSRAIAEWLKPPGYGSFGSSRSRHPDLRAGVREREARRHHADDLGRPLDDRDLLADDVRVGAEARPPETFADHRDLWTVFHVLGFGESASQARRDLEERKEIRRHPRDGQTIRLRATVRIGYVRRTAVVGRDAGDRVREALVRVVGAGRLLSLHQADRRQVVPRADELLGMSVRQRPQQDGVDDGEYRGRGSDADRQRSDDGDAEARGAAKRAEGVRNRRPRFHDTARGGVTLLLRDGRAEVSPDAPTPVLEPVRPWSWQRRARGRAVAPHAAA